MTHKPRKRFGQNFLHDTRIINAIIGHLQIRPHEHWVEIGPGQGALTVPLLQQASRLEIIELDRDLVRELQQRFTQQTQLTIYSADALQFDFTTLASDGLPLRIVGNLPYNISTPLLFHLLSHSSCIQDMTFMLQKEVVDRLCAQPGSKTYGRLSIMVQYYCATEYLLTVPPESFNPAPSVTSAVVRLTPYAQPQVAVHNIKHLEFLLIQAFAQRRKTVRNALKKVLNEQVWSNVEIDPLRRPETLSLAEFAKLSNVAQKLII